MYCSIYIYMAVHSHISCPPSITEKWIENSSYKSSLNRKFRQNEVILHFLLRIHYIHRAVDKEGLLFSLGPLTWAKLEGKKLPNSQHRSFSCFCQDFWVTWYSKLGPTRCQQLNILRYSDGLVVGKFIMYYNF